MEEAFAWPALNQSTQAELAALRDKACHEGRAQGLSEGRAAAAAEIAELKNTLTDAVTSFAGSRQTLAATDARLLARQLEELARALIGAELETNPRIVESLVAEALSAVSATRAELRIRISPEDEDRLSGLDAVSVEIDPTQAPGSILVESPEMDLLFDPQKRLTELLADVQHEEATVADPDPVPRTH